MLRHLLTLVALLVISSSCAFPTLEPQERCIVSVEHQACICHVYEIKQESSGSISENVIHPIEYCEKLVGFKPKEWGELTKWHRSVFNWVQKNYKSNGKKRR